MKNRAAPVTLSDMARPREKPPQAVKTLERGLRVLEALAQAGESPLGPLAERVGLAKSTLYRLLRALAQAPAAITKASAW